MGCRSPTRENKEAIAAKAAELKVAAARASASALLTNIQTAATDLTNELFPASPSGAREWGGGPGQVELINQAVNEVINKTKDAGANALKNAPDELGKVTAAAMKGQTENGWFLAVIYQRILVNGATALNDLGNGGLNVMMTPAERDFATVWGCRNLFNWGGRTCSDEMNTYFREYSTELAALDQLRGAFAGAGAGSSGIGTNSSASGSADAVDPGFLAREMNNFMYWLASVENTNDWRDPIPQMQRSGQSIMKFGTGVLAIAGVANVGADFIKVPGLGKVIAGLGGMVEPLGWGLVAIGAGLAFVVPMMPIFYFFAAAISWLALVVQTIITAPFWLMQMYYANRSGGISNTSLAKALTVLLALLIRPALIIVGLVFCMYMMRVGLDYLNILSHNFIATLGLASTGLGTSVLNIVGITFSWMGYFALVFILVTICCGFIDGVGDWVMDQVEAGASRVSAATGRQHAESGLGNPAAGVTAAAFLSGVQTSRQRAITAFRSKRTKPPTKPPLAGSAER
ncbi:DotA/TraY family protein [Brucella sp. NM4]|uniref:DotA/TraY family protein n=1 Tax=Brucella sp. NM4 TaxID=3045175 RepID=UPI0032D9B566